MNGDANMTHEEWFNSPKQVARRAAAKAHYEALDRAEKIDLVFLAITVIGMGAAMVALILA